MRFEAGKQMKPEEYSWNGWERNRCPMQVSRSEYKLKSRYPQEGLGVRNESPEQLPHKEVARVGLLKEMPIIL